MLWEFKNLMTRRVRCGGRTAAIGLLLAWALIPSPSPAQSYPRGDGQVRLFNYHLNEFAEIRFRDGEKILPEGLSQVNALLRSRDNSAQAPIDPRLLDLADHLQDHFQADTVEIISGYRRKEFNESLLKSGRAVSPVSLHTKGQALDIHIDEVREETLRDYLQGLGLGGVGYYGPMDFIHIDVGPVRRWGEGAGTRKLVGVLRPETPVQLTSDKNDYLPGETLLFTWTLPEGLSPDRVQGLRLELFRRGKWIACPVAETGTQEFRLPAASLQCEGAGQGPSYGKFRWVFQLPGDPAPLSSNEFYLKKL
ncbi:MAG: DUF882 domain-containing protein [Deltaproteobacteria bacterium]|nr:DUF882 domain-containing protein [Deltaproteobacteria bacterium]